MSGRTNMVSSGVWITGRCDMKLSDLTFEKIENYDPFNSRAKNNGMVTEWVARNSWGNAVAFGDTKKECLQDARGYVALQNKKDRRF